MSNSDPIGVFDSGVGGLSVLRRIQSAMPHEDLCYIADSAHAPYGNKDKAYIEHRSVALAAWLFEKGAKAVVVACNTATASAISTLRSMFSQPIIGMEPAVKPAAEKTLTGVIGILATANTFKSNKFSRLKNRFGNGVSLLTQPCPGLVEQVEKADLTSPTTRNLLEDFVNPLLKQGADTLVLGCTHYPFLSDLIQDIAGPDITVIDTGGAVAREVYRRLKASGLLKTDNKTGIARFWSSGNPHDAQQVMTRLWDSAVSVQRFNA